MKRLIAEVQKSFSEIFGIIQKLLEPFARELEEAQHRAEQKRNSKLALARHTAAMKAKGEVVSDFHGLLEEIMNKTLRVYHESHKQNFYTQQAQRDIKKIYIEVINSYVRKTNG